MKFQVIFFVVNHIQVFSNPGYLRTHRDPLETVCFTESYFPLKILFGFVISETDEGCVKVFAGNFKLAKKYFSLCTYRDRIFFARLYVQQPGVYNVIHKQLLFVFVFKVLQHLHANAFPRAVEASRDAERTPSNGVKTTGLMSRYQVQTKSFLTPRFPELAGVLNSIGQFL
jgi:hypothetical protein